MCEDSVFATLVAISPHASQANLHIVFVLDIVGISPEHDMTLLPTSTPTSARSYNLIPCTKMQKIFFPFRAPSQQYGKEAM